MNLGEKIKHLRVKKGMTQADLADAIGATAASVSNYERNMRIPQYPVLYAIADILDVPLSELLIYTENDENSGKNEPEKEQIDNKRPIRLKRLLAAFEKLSDEAQMKAVVYAEDLALIGIYRASLPETLQRYIYSKYQFAYEPESDTEEQKMYEEPNPFTDDAGCQVNIRHITLKKETDTRTSYWHFKYYQFSRHVRYMETSFIDFIDDEVYEFDFTEDSRDRYSLILDSQEAYEQFYRRCFDRMADWDLDEYSSTADLPQVSFFLIDKETCEIKDMITYDNY